MKCAQCLDILDDYFRGLLPEDIQISITKHLAACPDCQAEYGSLKALLELLEKEPSINVTSDELADFLPHVWAKIEKAKPKRRWFGRLVPSMATAAILAMLVFRPAIISHRVQISADNPSQLSDSSGYGLYTEDVYQNLLGSLFPAQDIVELEAIENELDLHPGVLVNESFESELSDLSNEGLEVFEKLLNEMSSIAG